MWHLLFKIVHVILLVNLCVKLFASQLFLEISVRGYRLPRSSQIDEWEGIYSKHCTQFSEISKGSLKTAYILLLTLLKAEMTSLETIVKEKCLMIF